MLNVAITILFNVTGIITFGIYHFVLFRNARSANVTTKSSFCFAIIIDDIPLYLQNVAIKVKGFFTALTAFNSPTSHFETTYKVVTVSLLKALHTLRSFLFSTGCRYMIPKRGSLCISRTLFWLLSKNIGTIETLLNLNSWIMYWDHVVTTSAE